MSAREEISIAWEICCDSLRAFTWFAWQSFRDMWR
jgi:hypothetical protein